jgi:hypothetical protein
VYNCTYIIFYRRLIWTNDAIKAQYFKYWFFHCAFFLIGIVGGGDQLGPLGTAATNRPIVTAPGDYDDGEIGGMMISKVNRSTRRKPAPVPLCPPQTPHAAWTRSQRLTAWAMAWPPSCFGESLSDFSPKFICKIYFSPNYPVNKSIGTFKFVLLTIRKCWKQKMSAMYMFCSINHVLEIEKIVF